MKTIFTQNDDFDHFVSFQIVTTVFFSHFEINHVIQQFLTEES